MDHHRMNDGEWESVGDRVCHWKHFFWFEKEKRNWLIDGGGGGGAITNDERWN